MIIVAELQGYGVIPQLMCRGWHYKKNILLQRAKTTAKGTFDLQRWVLLRWFFLPLLQCHYKSSAMVTKNAAVYTPFSGSFGFLWQAKNHHHMRLEFVLIDFQWWVMYAAIGVHLQRRAHGTAIGNQFRWTNCTFRDRKKRRYICEPLVVGRNIAICMNLQQVETLLYV